MSEELSSVNNESPASSDSWVASLPEELRTIESLNKFKDVASLAQSYLEAERSLTTRVAMPKNEASEEEWGKFYQKLGLPEDKKYLDTRPKEDEEYLSKYEEMFYESGLSQRQGKKLLEHLYKYSSNLQNQQSQKLEEVKTANLEWLKSNYGDNFDGNMTIMQAALSKFGTKELASLIEESSYSPALVDLLVKVGGILKSDSLVTGNNIPAITGSDAALKEIKRLESDSEFMVKLNGKNHTGHEEAVRRMEELYKLAYDQQR